MHDSTARSRLVETEAEAKRLVQRLQTETSAHPFRTVGLAAGVGYILGGGLFSPLTARLTGLALRIGLQFVSGSLLTEGLAAAGIGSSESGTGPKHGSASSSSSKRSARAET